MLPAHLKSDDRSDKKRSTKRETFILWGLFGLVILLIYLAHTHIRPMVTEGGKEGGKVVSTAITENANGR